MTPYGRPLSPFSCLLDVLWVRSTTHYAVLYMLSMVFMLVIMMYPATTNTAVIVRTEAVSEVDLTVYGRLRTVRSPNVLTCRIQ